MHYIKSIYIGSRQTCGTYESKYYKADVGSIDVEPRMLARVSKSADGTTCLVSRELEAPIDRCCFLSHGTVSSCLEDYRDSLRYLFPIFSARASSFESVPTSSRGRLSDTRGSSSFAKRSIVKGVRVDKYGRNGASVVAKVVTSDRSLSITVWRLVKSRLGTVQLDHPLLKGIYPVMYASISLI